MSAATTGNRATRACLTLTPAAPDSVQWEHHEHDGFRSVVCLNLDTYDTVWAAYIDHAPSPDGPPPGVWYGRETRKDSSGSEWSRTFRAVVDDFGRLIEVSL